MGRMGRAEVGVDIDLTMYRVDCRAAITERIGNSQSIDYLYLLVWVCTEDEDEDEEEGEQQAARTSPYPAIVHVREGELATTHHRVGTNKHATLLLVADYPSCSK